MKMTPRTFLILLFGVSDFSSAFSIIKTNYEVTASGKLQLTCQTNDQYVVQNYFREYFDFLI